jgi:hypothetical protein
MAVRRLGPARRAPTVAGEEGAEMNITRKWAMPSADTFDVPPIGEFVKSYLRKSKVSVDPFARNKRWATYTNDLNPKTAAECHMPALDFLRELAAKDVKADLIIFDPPYTINQIEEVYAGIGRAKFTFEEYSHLGRWNDEKNICNEILTPAGMFLHFGYHTNGMGKERRFEIAEILMVAHGGARYDTICMAERKLAHQPQMFAQAQP